MRLRTAGSSSVIASSKVGGEASSSAEPGSSSRRPGSSSGCLYPKKSRASVMRVCPSCDGAGRCQLASLDDEGLHLVRRARLGVDPQERLRPREADQEPGAVLAVELEPVPGVELDPLHD